ncbi:MAG TPA: hypothetical protein VMH04_18290 [Candidatus Solibacter sp.]|nr:hypothetical protein [Candidatus Solibacter sp.]
MSNMKDNSNRGRVAFADSKLEGRLGAYVATAAAAGVGVLALTQAAEAKVVYTPAHLTVTNGATIDLNHDRVADFSFVFWAPYFHSVFLDVTPLVNGNAVRGVGNSSAACGFLGVPVGPGEGFKTNSGFGHGVRMAGFVEFSSAISYGPWADVTNRYLGFKFLINGQVHYGWARLSVAKYLQSVLLTGYAYETTPNKTIIEGHISGPEIADAFVPANLLTPGAKPATLGMLARGSDGLALWRREEEAVAN